MGYRKGNAAVGDVECSASDAMFVELDWRIETDKQIRRSLQDLGGSSELSLLVQSVLRKCDTLNFKQ